MPYITEDRRKELEIHAKIMTCGELNYVISKVIKMFLDEHEEHYQRYNDILGALEGAKLELYRRKIALYEDKMKDANGDVY